MIIVKYAVDDKVFEQSGGWKPPVKKDKKR